MEIPNSIELEEITLSGGTGIELLCRRAQRTLWMCVRDGRRVVLKGLAQALINHPEYVAALRKEYLLTLKAERQGVVRVYGFEHHPMLGPVIVMEYVDGVALNIYQSDRKKSLPLFERRFIAYELATTIASFHRAGVAHRDLKPDNILICHDSNRPKIIDFGHGDSLDFVIYKSSVGTPQYGAPEQQQPSLATFPADVYAFGKILDDLLPERQFKSLRARCMAVDEDERPTMDEVAARLKPHSLRRGELILLVSALCVACAVILPVVNWMSVKESAKPVTEAVIDGSHDEEPENQVYGGGVAPAVDSAQSTTRNETGDEVETKRHSSSSSLSDRAEDNSTVTESEASVSAKEEEILSRYKAAADKINAKYGRISYEGEWEEQQRKQKLRLERGNEHYALSDKMKQELAAIGVSSSRIEELYCSLWTHIVFATNKIDGADEVRDKAIKQLRAQ